MRTTPLPRLGLVFSLAMAGPLGHAQTFNVAHASPTSLCWRGRSVFPVDSGYLVFGEQCDPGSLNMNITTSVFDHAGQLVSSKVFAKTGSQWIGFVDPVARASWGEGFIGAVSSPVHDQIYGDTLSIWRFNDHGDTLWTKYLLDDALVGCHKTIVRGGKVYLTGLRTNGLLYPAVKMESFVARTDTNGVPELIAGLDSVRSYTMEVDADGNMYIGGIGKWPFAVNSHGYLIKLDTVGVPLWCTVTPGWYGGVWEIKLLSNGNILCAGTKRNSIAGTDTTRLQLTVFDPDGALVWSWASVTGSFWGRWTAMNALYQDTDSTFIAAGGYVGKLHGLAWNRALIYRFTLDGDSLWRRDYYHYNACPYCEETPWALQPTPDGGMVLTGNTVLYTNQLKLWLLKLDSMGCLVPGCQYVGVQEQMVGLEGAFQAAPNPGDGVFHLRWAPPADLPVQGALRLQVFDMTGRTVLRKELGRRPEQSMDLDLTGRPPGAYAAFISDDARIIAGVRLMLQ